MEGALITLRSSIRGMIKVEEKAETKEEFKICSGCDRSKPLSKFGKDKTKKSGLHCICKECKREYAKEYRKFHKEEKREYTKAYYKEHSEDLCAYGKEYRKDHKENLCGYYKDYYKDHREKSLAYAKKYNKSHKEEQREYKKNYQQTEAGRITSRICRHLRRARKAGAGGDGISAEQWQRIIVKQRNKCNMCKKRFAKSRLATIDHIIPLSKGGDHDASNIQALCKSCNNSKHAKIQKGLIVSW